MRFVRSFHNYSWIQKIHWKIHLIWVCQHCSLFWDREGDWFCPKHMSRAWLICPSSPIVLTMVETGKMSEACIDTCFGIQLSEIDLRTIDHEFRDPMSHHIREHNFQEFSQSILPGKAPSSVTHKSKKPKLPSVTNKIWSFSLFPSLKHYCKPELCHHHNHPIH